MADNNNEVRNPFDEYSFEVLAALNHLITTNEVCKNDKAVMKINRFKKWLLDFTATEQKDNSMNV